MCVCGVCFWYARVQASIPHLTCIPTYKSGDQKRLLTSFRAAVLALLCFYDISLTTCLPPFSPFLSSFSFPFLSPYQVRQDNETAQRLYRKAGFKSPDIESHRKIIRSTLVFLLFFFLSLSPFCCGATFETPDENSCRNPNPSMSQH